jgi:hypothetical protein
MTLGHRSTTSLARLKRLEQARLRVGDFSRLSDDELLMIVFGYETPELHAAQALQRAGDDAGLERMLQAMAGGRLSRGMLEERHAGAI